MSEADHASLVRLLRRLDDIPKGMTDIEAVANLIDPARRAWFLNLDAAEFKRLHDQERLGLAMIDTVSSRIDLAHPLIHEARLPAGDGSGTVTLAGGGHRIRFPVVRIDGEWYLAIGDVLRFVEED